MPSRRRRKRESPGLQSEAPQTKTPRTIYRGKIAAGAAEGQQLASPPDFTVYSDGACLGNPGPAGYAWVMDGADGRKTAAFGLRHSTNNRAELWAVIDALTRTPQGCSVCVFSDSEYVTKGAIWAQGWRARGWRLKTTGQTPKNVDLWRSLVALTDARIVSFVWLKGHAGHPENELADSLAQDACGFPYENRFPDLEEPKGVRL